MLNVIALMGRLVAEPELRHTPNGIATCTFRIAVDRSFVKQGEERKADFIDIVVWRGTAEFVCKYFHKGSLIAVNGSLQTRNYEDKNGNKRTAFEVVADNVHFAGSKDSSSNYTSQQNSSMDSVRNDAPAVSGFSAGSSDDFSVVSDNEDLPF